LTKSGKRRKCRTRGTLLQRKKEHRNAGRVPSRKKAPRC